MFVDSFKKTTSNWLRYVNCARTPSEINLEAFQYKGNIYYITRCDIKRWVFSLFYPTSIPVHVKEIAVYILKLFWRSTFKENTPSSVAANCNFSHACQYFQ